MKNPDEKISEYRLERYLLKELPLNEMNEIEKAVKQNPNLQKQLENLELQNQVFLTEHPPERFLKNVQHRIATSERIERAKFGQKSGQTVGLREWEKSNTISPINLQWYSPGKKWALVLGLLALVVSPILWKSQQSTSLSEKDVVRIKGNGPALLLYRKTLKAPEQLADGDSVQAGDVIQASIKHDAYREGVLFSIDGNGSITLHWPARPGFSASFDSLENGIVPLAFQLDDAPYFERFYLIVSNHKFNLDSVFSHSEVLKNKTNDINYIQSLIDSKDKRSKTQIKIITMQLNKQNSI